MISEPRSTDPELDLFDDGGDDDDDDLENLVPDMRDGTEAVDDDDALEPTNRDACLSKC